MGAATSAANDSASEPPPEAEASARASIGPAIGPPSKADATVGEAAEQDVQGVGVAGNSDARGGDSSRGSAGGKRAREGEAATALVETVVQRPRVNASTDARVGVP